MTDTTLNLPPYGNKLYHSISNDVYPKNSVYVFVGEDCWEKAKSHDKNKYAMCLPDHIPAMKYDWPVKNCEVIIWYNNKFLQDIEKALSELEILAMCLFRNGAHRVLIEINNRLISVYGKDSYDN